MLKYAALAVSAGVLAMAAGPAGAVITFDTTQGGATGEAITSITDNGQQQAGFDDTTSGGVLGPDSKSVGDTNPVTYENAQAKAYGQGAWAVTGNGTSSVSINATASASAFGTLGTDQAAWAGLDASASTNAQYEAFFTITGPVATIHAIGSGTSTATGQQSDSEVDVLLENLANPGVQLIPGNANPFDEVFTLDPGSYHLIASANVSADAFETLVVTEGLGQSPAESSADGAFNFSATITQEIGAIPEPATMAMVALALAGVGRQLKQRLRRT